MTLITQLLSAIWGTAQAMAPWLLLGFLIAGILSLLISPALVCRFLGRAAGKRAIALAVLLGVPLPLCSCGVLPLAASLKRSGASKGAVAAFLISTPQTGIDSFFATGSLLGWCFAIVRPLVATLSGLIGGVTIHAFDTEAVASSTSTETEMTPPKSLLGKAIAALHYGYGTLLKGIAPALFLGLLISALILVFVPDSFFDASILGSDWIAFPTMLLIGMPMYVCSTASIPVALALMAKGISPGAALIFLIVGPALNGASLAVLLQILGKRCMMIYLALIAVAAVVAGLALNGAVACWELLPNYAEYATNGCNTTCGWTAYLRPGCAILLFALLAWHLIIRPLFQRLTTPSTIPQAAENSHRIVVKKMRCDHCRGAVQRLLSAYPTVSEVTRIDNETFLVKGDIPDTLAADIQQLGFELAE
jgi:uncharacterized membrane protein YraQ (UPF0718 family)